VDATTQVLTSLIIAAVLALSLIAEATTRRRAARSLRRGITPQPPPLRPLPAADSVPLVIGAAIEADRPVHLSFGSAGIGGPNTILAAAAAEAFYQIARRTATGDLVPLLTVSEASALALGAGTLRRAYADRGRRDRFSFGAARWYPQGDRSLAFAAAVSGMIAEERAAGSVLIGSFGVELALILDSVGRRRALSIAGSDQLDGQAVAYVLADRALIGEEMFVVPAYLADQPGAEGRVVALDTLRWLLIVGLIAAAALVLRETVAAALTGAAAP